MDVDSQPEVRKKRERNFAQLQLNTESVDSDSSIRPVLVVQSPKTPTLSRKLKAVSLDSDAGQNKNLEVNRDVSSVPNTPKKQAKKEATKLGYTSEFDSLSDFTQKATLTPLLGSNLKRFASNQSISGSQTLKTLPEVMTLQDFTGAKTESIRIKAKGLLERRGSNASLTIDLGSNTSLSEPKPTLLNFNTAKSVSHINLTTFSCEKCTDNNKNPTIYEQIPTNSSHKHHLCKCNLKFLPRYYVERHCVCNTKFRRKSLSNENLYVPPCNFCHFGSKECYARGSVRGSRRALYPRQTYIENSQLLSEDFKLHLQNVQYLQTAGSVLSVADLKACCQMDKIPRLHQEFWEIPLNLQEKCLVSGSQTRNRYKGVLPNEHSRVHLPGTQPYIHANYIKGPDYTETAYVATQGPMSHTCEDFWNLIWSTQAKQIVMLTGLIEKGRSKCELYFPLGEENKLKDEIKTRAPTRRLSPFAIASDSIDDDFPEVIEADALRFGPYQIKYLQKELLGECAIRTLELSRDGNEPSRTLYHYWYPNWEDHTLANPEQVLKIALRVLGIGKDSKNSSTTESTSSDMLESDSSSVNEEKRKLDNKFDVDDKVFSFDIDTEREKRKFTFEKKEEAVVASPITVHCSAGIGRTGCFLAILNGIQQLRTNYNVDILAIVCSLRLNRGGMVQTAEQYELIHRVLSLYTEIF